MTNFFYIDANGQKQGPIDNKQLITLAAQGVVKPTTMVEADTGWKGNAEQITGLVFGSAVPPIPEPRQPKGVHIQTEPVRPKGAHIQQEVKNDTGVGADLRSYGQQVARSHFVAWLLDFGFRDIRLPILMLRLTQIFYAIFLVLTVLSAIIVPVFWAIIAVNNARDVAATGVAMAGILVMTLIFWFILAITLIYARLFYEFGLILLDWLVETTKAARIYIENNENERKTDSAP